MKNILAISLLIFLGFSARAQASEPIVTSTMEEECATYPTGYEGLMKFINNEVNYPQDCVDLGISGKVYIRFVVDRSGNVSKATVTKSAHPSLDKEALRVTNLLHWNWNPACKDSAMYMSLPINFEVGDDTEPSEDEVVGRRKQAQYLPSKVGTMLTTSQPSADFFVSSTASASGLEL